MRKTPPTDSAGVIRGGSGSASAVSFSLVVSLVVALPDAVGVSVGVLIGRPSETVAEGTLDTAEEAVSRGSEELALLDALISAVELGFSEGSPDGEADVLGG